MNIGRKGEILFKQKMQSKGHLVEDVTSDPQYYDKDIDFIITSFSSGETKTFEVKTDTLINKTGNMFIELVNPRSKQWNGEGWYLHCKADYLAYGDYKTKQFYMFDFEQLKQRIQQIKIKPHQTTSDGAKGWLINLKEVEDLYTIF